MSILRRIKQIRRLSRVIRPLDAVKLSLLQSSSRDLVSVHSTLLNRSISIRPGTTDLKVMDKILIRKEYLIPFNVQPKLIVDAGANVGFASLYFNREYPNAKIIAIEPENSNFAILKRNIDGISMISAIEGALWNDNQGVSIAKPDADKWAISVNTSSPTRDIKSVTVNDILHQYGGWIDILKLDIEGAEKSLFSCKSPDWLRQIGMIVIELHDRYVPGCTSSFYNALSEFNYAQEIRGENIFIQLNQVEDAVV